VGFDIIIFDLDGTLIDTRADIASAVNDMLRHFGLPLMEVEEVTGYIGDGLRPLVERCVPGDSAPFDEAVKVFERAYWERKLETTKPYPGVQELLEKLGDKLKAVLTNKPYSYTRAIIDGLGMGSFFSVVVGGDTVKHKKPSIEGVEHILNKSGAQKKGAVIVGDGKNDILTAKNAGIASVFAAYGFGKVGQLGDVSPDFVINSPLELLDIC